MIRTGWGSFISFVLIIHLCAFTRRQYDRCTHSFTRSRGFVQFSASTLRIKRIGRLVSECGTVVRDLEGEPSFSGPKSPSRSALGARGLDPAGRVLLRVTLGRDMDSSRCGPRELADVCGKLTPRERACFSTKP